MPNLPTWPQSNASLLMSTASSIWAVIRARANGSRSFNRTSSAHTTCSRQRGGPGSNASSSRPSNHAVGFYPRDQRIDHRVVPRPDSRYGVSKAFAEALASLYADKHGIGFLCTRIGNFGEKPIDKRRLSIWISPRDYTQLVRIGLEHPDIRYEIVYGVSNNRRSWYDNSNAERLGYRPQDNSEPFAEAVLAAEAGQHADPIAERYQGGTFCAAEYTAAAPRP